MLKKRIIPTLLIKGDQLVKSTKYKNHSYVGDPINVIKIFNEKEVDEIIILDIEKSISNKDPNYELIRDLASECYMPLTYGGGIKSIEQAEKLFSIGIEKITLNSINYKNLNLMKQITNKFGSQSVIAAVDLNKNIFNKLYLYDWIKKKNIKLSIKEHIQQCIKYGAGELLINFVFNEGTLCGFNKRLVDFIDFEIPIPLIINGGINSKKNISECLNFSKIDAVGIGAYFIYYGPHKAVLISYITDKEE